MRDPEQTPPVQQAPQRPRARRHWAVWGAMLCILFGAGYLLSQRSTQPSGQSKKGKQGGGAIPVAVAQVSQGNIGVYISAIGTVTPVYTVSVTSRVVGQLLQVNYREGQMVHKGDLLAVVDPRPYQAVFTQAEGQLARDQALLKNAYIDLDRYKMIYQQHAIPEQQLATQQATVDQDQGTVKLDQGNLDAAKVNLDYTQDHCSDRWPYRPSASGPGNIVQANGTAPLLTITQIQPITVIFTMAEDYLSEVITQMRAGHKLRVDALDRDSQTDLAQGTVLTIDNQIDTTTGTVKVRATFSNRDFKLFPNEFVNAKLLVRTLDNVNLIPTAAIQRNSDVAFVYVVNPTTKAVQSRNINIATTDGDTAAVTGVSPGETLVTDGFDRLQDGVKVVIRKPTVPTNETRTPEANQTAADQTQQGNAGTQINTNQQNSQQVQTKQVHPK